MNESNIALEEAPFLVVSDVHADPKALERVLKDAGDLRYKCFLGDSVGYGKEPHEALDMLSHFDVGVEGNHDSLLLDNNDVNQFSKESRESIKEHRKKLKENDLEILSLFVPSFSRDGMLLFHGSPKDENEYLFNEVDIKKLLRFQPDYDLLFGGHLHLPRLVEYDKKTGELNFLEIEMPFSRHILDLKNKKYLVNVPSVTPGRMDYDKIGYCAIFPVSEHEKAINFIFTN